MTDKILIAYSSYTGYTDGVAECIRQTLAESGIPVERYYGCLEGRRSP